MFHKKQRILAWILAMVMMIGTMPMSIVNAGENRSLIADDLQEESLVADLTVGEFTIKARADKSVVIDASSKTADDGSAFSRRIKLGGTGSVDYRSIHFSVSNKTEVKLYALSSSSSSDRKLSLYDLSGNLVGEVDALGSSIVAGTLEVEAGDYYLASPSSGVNVYGVVLKDIIVPVIMTLNISSMDDESIVTNKEVNGFTIKAAADKSVVIDSSSKSATDGTSFTKRMKLGGSGSAEARSIHFTVTGDSEVKAYAMSSSSSSDRKLGLYSADGTSLDEMDALGSSLESATFNVAAGDYYLASPSSGVNVYEVIVTTGKPVEVIRGPWENVAAPTITSVSQYG